MHYLVFPCAVLLSHSNPGIYSAGLFKAFRSRNPAGLFVLKSRTETDARKEDSVIFVLISQTNFSRNFVRVYVQQSGISVQRDQ
jgi:hypothetical protein